MRTNMRYAWIAGLLLLVTTLEARELPSGYFETSKPGGFLKSQSLTPNTLVILDLDDTTITTPEGQWLGRSDMFYDLLAQEQKKYPDKSNVDLASVIDVLLIAVYERVPVTVTDHSLPAVLRSLTDNGVSVIAMTSRGKKVRDVTLKQLEEVGIRFTDLGESRWINIDKERSFRVEKGGVVFASHGNKKGEVLIRLFEEGYFKGKNKIYLIDDRERHLDNVAFALKQYADDIDYIPVHCTYLKNKQPYNSSEANEQLMHFLIDKKEVPEIRALLQHDPYTKEMVNKCSLILSENKEHCQSLKEFGFKESKTSYITPLSAGS